MWWMDEVPSVGRRMSYSTGLSVAYVIRLTLLRHPVAGRSLQ